MTTANDANSTVGQNYLVPLYDPVGHQYKTALRAVNVTHDTGVSPDFIYGDLAVDVTFPTSQRVNANSGDFVTGSIADLATLLALEGTPTDANTVNSIMGRLTKIRDLLNGTLNVGQSSEYPIGATPITASSGNKANAIATATLAASSGVTTYITGFEVTGSGATLGLPVIVTVSNIITGTMSYIYGAIAGVLTNNTPLIIQFTKAIPANATNTTIVVSCPALGLGNTNNVVNAHGYQL
jgi:hypothetical protein